MKLALLLSALAASAVPVPQEFGSPDEVNAAAETLASLLQALQEQVDRMADRTAATDATQAVKETNAGVADAVGSGNWAGSGSISG